MTGLLHRAHKEIRAARDFREQLSQITDDEEVINDTLEGEIDLPGVAELIVRSIDEDEAIVDGLSERIKQYQQRVKRAKDRIERKRALIIRVIESSGRKSMVTLSASLSTRSVAPSLLITDEAKIPAIYWKQPPPVIDKSKLEDAIKNIKDGEFIEGATLTNGSTSLTIRKS